MNKKNRDNILILDKEFNESEMARKKSDADKAAGISAQKRLEQEKLAIENLCKRGNFSKASVKKLITNLHYRKDLDVILKKSLSNNQTFNKSTTALFKHLNFRASSSGNANIHQLSESLRHSARINHRIETSWDNTMTERNLYLTSDGKIVSHDEFQKIHVRNIESFINNCHELSNNEHDKKLKMNIARTSKLRSSYKNKLSKLVSEPKLQKLVDKIIAKTENTYKEKQLSEKANTYLIEQLIKIVARSKMPQSRRNSKHNVIKNYFRHRNDHLSFKNKKKVLPNKNSLLVSELLFKIPSNNPELGLKQCDLLRAVDEYTKITFQQYPLIYAASHIDEPSASGNYEPHVHFFINCRNSKTGAFDFNRNYIDIARKKAKHFSKTLDVDFNLPDKGYRFSKKEMVIVGQVMNLDLYYFIQKKLLNKYEVNIKYLSTEEKYNDQYIQNILEQHLPKSQRKSNYINMLNDNVDLLIKRKNNTINKNALLTKKNHTLQKRSELLESDIKIKVDAIRAAIELWKINSNNANLVTNHLHTLNEFSDIQEALMKEIQHFEELSFTSDKNKISNKINRNSKPKPK